MNDVIRKRIGFYSLLYFDFLFFTVLYLLDYSLFGKSGFWFYACMAYSAGWLLFLIVVPRECPAILELMKLVSASLIEFIMIGGSVIWMFQSDKKIYAVFSISAALITAAVYFLKMDKRIRGIFKSNFYYEDVSLVSPGKNWKPAAVMVLLMIFSCTSFYFYNLLYRRINYFYPSVVKASIMTAVPPGAVLICKINVPEKGLSNFIIAHYDIKKGGKVYFYLDNGDKDSSSFDISIIKEKGSPEPLFYGEFLRERVTMAKKVLVPGEYKFILNSTCPGKGLRISLYAFTR